MLNPNVLKNPSGMVSSLEMHIAGSTYIVVLCLGLLVISIILEIIKVRIIRKKEEQNKKEIRTFLILLVISLITLLFFVKENGLYTIEGIVAISRRNSIWYIMLNIILVINIIMVVKPLIYIIKHLYNKVKK